MNCDPARVVRPSVDGYSEAAYWKFLVFLDRALQNGKNMPPTFDPYLEWLGIPVAEQPPDHYRLLGVERFCADADAMADAADRLLLRVGAHQSGERSDTARRLLAELTAAKLCLCNPDTRAAYDAALKSGPAATGRSTSAGASAATMPSRQAPEPPPNEPDAAPIHGGDRRAHESPITGQWFVPVMVVGILLLATLSGMVALAWSVKHRRPAARPSSESPSPPGSLLDSAGADPAGANSADDVTSASEPDDDVGVFMQDPAGRIHCLANLATIHGTTPKIVRRADRPVVALWTSRDDWLRWDFDVELPGIFRVDVTYASADTSSGGRFSLDVGGGRKTVTVRGTGRNDNFVTEEIGFLTIRRRGRQTLLMKVQSKPPGELMALESILLTPTLTGAKPPPRSD